MSTKREQIEHLEHGWQADTWKKFSYSRRWLKQQMNRFLRRQGKKIEDDDIGRKTGRKPFLGWEY